jgi:hypothetical protein
MAPTFIRTTIKVNIAQGASDLAGRRRQPTAHLTAAPSDGSAGTDKPEHDDDDGDDQQ